MKYENNTDKFCFVHVSPVYKISVTNEIKTKPTQNSVKQLRHLGITPDIMVIRADDEISENIRKKLALFCQVSEANIIINKDSSNIYKIPLQFLHQKMDELIAISFNLSLTKINQDSLVKIPPENNTKINIGIVGKYTEFVDSYVSLVYIMQVHIYNTI